MNSPYPDALSIATAIQSQEITAEAICTATLNDIHQRNSQYNCFTDITAERAIASAQKIDQMIKQGQNPGRLAGVPFAVKNLFDIEGLITLAGSIINRDNTPAIRDATVVLRLQQAGAVLVGTLNMDEYAYGFVTENAHYGTTPNPHDLTRISGGSSGGSAAAIAAGFVPLTLGSDTNGSIRVPAALCGVFGFKPTYGRLSRSGVFPLANSLDHVGPFAASVQDIATVYDILQGPDPTDPVCTQRPPELCFPQLDQGIDGLRIAMAGGYFAEKGEPEALQAVTTVATALGVTQEVEIPNGAEARMAAFVITANEGGQHHLKALRARPQDFDPATRDRFLAGALIPSTWYLHAQRFRRWYQEQILNLFKTVDILLAPTTPCIAPKIGQENMIIAGEEVLVRQNLGLYTQPLSFIGLPVLSVPVCESNQYPLGVQIIAAPYQEALILRVAKELEEKGVIAAKIIKNC